MDFPSAKQEFTKWSDLCKKAMYFSFYGMRLPIYVSLQETTYYIQTVKQAADKNHSKRGLEKSSPPYIICLEVIKRLWCV